MQFIPLNKVKLNDPLWSPRISIVRDVMLPYQWDVLNDRVENAPKSHCIENFRIAAGESTEDYYGMVFQDSDLYKWIEAAAYCLSAERDGKLEKICDDVIALIERAQQRDGYINTYYTVVAPEKRWTNLMEGHELYCAGHLIEASVAYYKATKKDRFLRIACRFADRIEQTFGTGKRRGYPGHPEIELALIRLYDVTEEDKYLLLSEYFINERGRGTNIFDEECATEGHTYIHPEMKKFKADYFQSHLPVREQKKATGHAVRAMYLYCAMADIACKKKDVMLGDSCKALYENMVYRKMYVTGGIGTAAKGEQFTNDYDLPSDSAYAETCASIGLMFLSSRMWLFYRKANYYDVWERALFNTVLSAMGQDGQHFFYVNPLEVIPDTIKSNPMLSHIKTRRQKWFGVACCPPNIARILSSMAGYLYAFEGNCLYILSHIGASFEKDGMKGTLSRVGDDYTLTIDSCPMDICLRVPENTELRCSINGDKGNGFLIIHHSGGRQHYRYSLIQKIRVLFPHPSISALSGKICVQRGSAIYCAEAQDNKIPLSSLRLPADAEFLEKEVDWLPSYMPVLKTNGYRVLEEKWSEALYREKKYEYEPCEITLIPYSQWGNRSEGEMCVWLTEKV